MLVRRKSDIGTMRVIPAIFSVLVALILLSAEFVALAVRGGTCGESEGGGSCSMGPLDVILLSGCVLALALAAVLLTVRRR